jgi:hypothetical protein
MWTEIEKLKLLSFVELNILDNVVDWLKYKDDVPGKSWV